jgi:lysyl-tRNA synthetase class 2
MPQYLRQRADILRAVRGYFDQRGYLEVETPTRVRSPGQEVHIDAFPAGDDRFLITSPEYHMKRLVAAGHTRIYQIARCFRAEELGPAHQPEFTLLEWYRAFADWEQIATDTEEVVVRVFRALGGFREPSDPALERPFGRVTVREAFERFAGVSDAVSLAARDADAYFELLASRVEPGLESLARPVFLTHYPLSQAALARPCPTDPTVAERFELYVGGSELSNGFGELTDPQEQRRRFELELQRRREASEPVYPLDERLLAALNEGLPPSAGNALGVDRLVSLALGLEDIGQTFAFSDEER